jgi:hypothetical protein
VKKRRSVNSKSSARFSAASNCFDRRRSVLATNPNSTFGDGLFPLHPDSHGRSDQASVVTISVTYSLMARDEQRAFAIASAFGRGSRLPLQVLDELRLLLRWLRFKGLTAEYEAAFGTLCDATIGIAAE